MNAIASSRVVHALLLTTMLNLAAPGWAIAEPNDAAEPNEAAEPEQRIVPPSEYVDDIETEGTTGGVEDEVDAADAQAEKAEHEGE